MKIKTVVYLDEDKNQRDLFEPRLSAVFELTDVEIMCCEPYSTVGETAKFLLELGDSLSALVTDERMHETGIADFKGSELAIELRELHQNLPIYILTTYPDDDDLQDNFAEFDYVISKQTINIIDEIPEKLKTLVARNLGNFHTSLSLRSQRIDELVEKSIYSCLEEEEATELSHLLKWQRGGNRILEHKPQLEFQKKLDRASELLNKIEDRLRKAGD